MSFLGRFRRNKEDPEIARRSLLLRTGRLGEATVLDTGVDSEGKDILSYSYTIGGVDYETVQRFDDEQLRRKDNYLPGSQVDLRYDPRRPANSVVV
jgi:Protein of unknown function (DUF3592)